MIRLARLSLGLLGVIVTSVGAALLLGLGVDNLVAAMVWLVAGVVVHDAVIGPLLIALGAANPGGKRWAAPLIQAGIVLATVTVVAIPVLGRFGARTDNPTLLDRNYVAGWLSLAAITLGAAGIVWLRTRRTRGGDDGSSPGR